MVRKCRGVAEIAVMEVDLRTTRPPPDLDDVPPSANKRKIAAETNFEFSTTTTSFVKLRSRRRRVVLPENSVPAPPAENTLLLPGTTSTKERSSISPTSDDDASTFACSSNGCSEIVEESKRETTPSSQFRPTQSGDMESPAGKSEATSSGNRSLSSVKMPAESELEAFFIAAEKNIQKRFTEKYNYDIIEDVPLEGRYEWVRLNI
ncbi:Cyclin-dependent kinase inhibitor 7, partial [Cucurbita argyrosperma subsp. argyrosperma]